jgi:Cleft lip and palate transmembrane protein 1 (CLPTM1)
MGGISGKTPDWHEEGLTYDFSSSNDRNLNLTLPVTSKLLSNDTLYLHMQVTIRNPFYKRQESKHYSGELEIAGKQKFRDHEFIKINDTIPLIRYLPKIKESTKRNLLSDDIPLPEQKKALSEIEEDDGKYYSYFKKELYLYLIYDNSAYSTADGGPPIQIRDKMRIDHETNMYYPITYLSDYWVLKRDLIMINETVKELNLSLHFNTYSLNYFIM